MTPVEVVARSMARIRYEAAFPSSGHPDGPSRRLSFINRHWRDHEPDAKALLRSLKGQPPHILEAVPHRNPSTLRESGDNLDAILEAMAR
jgi:hypothetical protein